MPQRKGLFTPQLCFHHVCWRTAAQSRPLLPQFIKCSPCDSSRMERTKEGKHQTEILNIVHWPALHSLVRFYPRTRTNAGKKGKNLPAILLSHCLLQLVWNHRVTLFLAGHLQRQHLELSFHFNYLLKPLIGRRE